MVSKRTGIRITAALVGLVAALLFAGCGKGTVLSGIAAPELPRDEATWLNGPADLAALRGKVVLVEAWHPS
jgi:hypothetical protein